MSKNVIVKRSVLALVPLLFFLVGAVSSPNQSMGGAKKQKAPPVDCSKVDDAAITSKVNEALGKMASLKNEKITVEVKDGNVTLTGAVKSKAKRLTAHRTAGKVECAKSVLNNIKSGPVGCSAGTHECCCPDSGCECVPNNRQCPTCASPKKK